jgi:hypothetical protein
MGDKSGLCNACGRFVAESERIGGEGEPYTYHPECAIAALVETEAELRWFHGKNPDLAKEIEWLRTKLGER